LADSFERQDTVAWIADGHWSWAWKPASILPLARSLLVPAVLSTLVLLLAPALPLVSPILPCLASSVVAQTSGKVQGSISDRDTGEPLAGAQVLIEGTRLGNIADETGFYFINDVPVGPQTVTAALLGYQSESQEHRILAGQTTTVDFPLSTEVIVADSAIVTVIELHPLVPRDNTISKSRFVRGEVEDLPLRSVEDLVTLAAGASGQQGGISLRGARPDDATVYVDGLNATDFSNVSELDPGAIDAGGDRSPLRLGQFSIEELDVVTGGADASLGDAQSGVINLVTRRGGPSLSGNVRFTTDALKIERTDDFYELQGNVGGPLLADGKASFFLSGQLRGSRATSDNFGFDASFEDIVAVGSRFDLDISRERFCDRGTCIPVRGGPLLPDLEPLPLLRIETFVRDYLTEKCTGTTCPADFFEENAFLFDDRNSDVDPGNFGDRYAFSGRLALTPSERTDLQLSWSRSREQGGGAPDLFNPFTTGIGKETVDLIVGSWRQIFHQAADRSLALDVRAGYFDDRRRAGNPFDPGDKAGFFPLLEGNRGGTDLLNFRFSGYELFLEDSVQGLIDDYRGSNAWEDLEAIRQALRLAGETVPVAPATSSGGPDIFGIGVFSFPLPTAGLPRGDLLLEAFAVNNRERRWNVRADLDAQISRIDRLRGGVDLKFFDVHRLNANLFSRGENTIYFVEPRLFGFYVTNRIDLGDFVLDLGGRIDRFDHNTALPEVPGLARTDEDGDGSTLREYDPKTAFGPRLGVAHPVTKDTQVRFSYGVFNQLPAFDELYRHITSDRVAGDFVGALIGNPDLDFQQTRSFELGLTHLLREDVVLDLVGYYRDVSDGTAARFFVLAQNIELNKLFNVNNGNVRGLDVTLSKRFGDYWSADATYSYLSSKLTDSDQSSFLVNRGLGATSMDPVPPPQLPLPADFDVTHKLNAVFSLSFPGDFRDKTFWGNVLQNLGLFATARFSSGLPFTRAAVSGENLELPNSSRHRSEFRADLRATRYFELGSGMELGAIVEVFNVFNNENLNNNENLDRIHETTGDRLLIGNEIRDAESQVSAQDLVLADIDTTAPGGALTREFRAFSDIDGDGLVTRAEQRIMGILAFGAANELRAQPKRSFRLGVELRF
jgi:outer membrane receptor protein involved in Fe transport